MYCVLEEKLELEPGSFQTVYGVACMEAQEVRISDLSASRETVDQLVDVLNEHALSPIHLQDFVDDWLGL